MMKNIIHVPSLAISGYRSFGKIPQFFEKFEKINLFIGENNCGKSNILKLIHEVLPAFNGQTLKLKDLDRNLHAGGAFQVGLALTKEKLENYIETQKIQPPQSNILLNIFERLCKLNPPNCELGYAWFLYNQNKQLQLDNLQDAFSAVEKNELNRLTSSVLKHIPSNDRNIQITKILEQIQPSPISFKSQFIPAIRKIGDSGSQFEIFDGNGIIEELAKYQNPEAGADFKKNREKFQLINSFLQNVLNDENAVLEIPYGRKTILVHLGNKTLPLENLGTGVHEVIILAAASTIMENVIICLEEPELHLHPLLQKKLIRYLNDNTSNQYFITTHSAALMDTPNAEIYQVSLLEGSSIISRVTADKHKASICKDLGYHPSDLIQANSIIWVEGPSDRIYLNYWINKIDPQLIEGIHYSIMFYGGRLLSHLTAQDPDEYIEDFISLIRLNRASAILIDSDKESTNKRLNKTKKRIEDEFSINGYVWITNGREIENYLPAMQLNGAIKQIHPIAVTKDNYDQYDKILALKDKNSKEINPNKVAIARYITGNNEPEWDILDLKKKINGLVSFINNANPKLD